MVLYAVCFSKPLYYLTYVSLDLNASEKSKKIMMKIFNSFHGYIY